MAGIGLATLGIYGLFVRPWHLAWGATRDECFAAMPGDELLPVATTVSTRAIDIDAPPEDVWPWLAQMGQGRGGLYSYDFLENLFGLDIHSVDHIVPELQSLQPGDYVPLSQERLGLIARHVAPPHELVFEFIDGGWVWSLVVVARGPGRSRLLVRNRWHSSWRGAAWRISFWVMEPAAFIMERKMLFGIRQRAEARSA